MVVIKEIVIKLNFILKQWRMLFLVLICGIAVIEAKEISLLNVSYDPTRELYTEYNAAFAKHWKVKTGDDITINQSHGGSGKQARSVIDGLDADVVTLALAGDINFISEKGKLLPSDWQKKLPYNSAPYTSTIVFLVRKGNPKRIKDWSDLVQPGVQIITPNPKTSGGARWNILAAYHIAKNQNNGDEHKAHEFLRKLIKNVPVLDAGARGSMTTFVERGIGDVLLAWENEAILVTQTLGKDRFEIVTPSSSIIAEPTVALVERVAKRRGTTEVASAYLNYLYSEEGQRIVAKHHYRPRDPKVAAEFSKQFGELKLFTIEEAFGGWGETNRQFFGEGGIYDKLSMP